MTAGEVASVEPQRARHRGRWLAAVVLVFALAAATAIFAAHPWRSAAKDNGNGTAEKTGLATVTRRDLVSQTQVDGTLGYAGSYSVLNQARGTLTWLPDVGDVIRQGQVLYRVDGTPVLLLYGRVPAYRDLAEGHSADDITGRDVRQLNAALVALGYATSDQLDPTSDEFGWQTKQAVERLQDHFGLDETGRLPRGSVVFLPRPLRVTTVTGRLGAQAGPGGPVLTGTSTTRVVNVDLDVAQQNQVKPGDDVAVQLPDGTNTPGVVTDVGRVATAPSAGSKDAPTVSVTVRLRRPRAAGTLDQAPVLVSITTARAADALVVPVTALLALAGGGYAVEIAGPDGAHSLVAATPGLFDDADGLVQVTGTGLSAGQRVVVPSS